MTELQYGRFGPDDADLAQAMFTMMAAVFEEESERLPREYLAALLSRDDVWVVSAVQHGEVVGGLTGYALPMTRQAMRELLIYDVAVREDCQRRGVGRRLLETTKNLAAVRGIAELFVLADNEDVHALDFYRAIGGTPGEVTSFSFGTDLVVR